MVVIMRAVAVPRLGWGTRTPIRVGAILMTAGMMLVTVASTGLLLGAAVAVLGTGLGFGMPGTMSAPTLLATRAEQGAVAGLISSSTALTFVLGPLLDNGLYEIAPAIRYLLCTVLLAGLTVFTFTHRGVRRTPESSASGKTSDPGPALCEAPGPPEIGGGGGIRTRVLRRCFRTSPGAACIVVLLGPGALAGESPTGPAAVNVPARPRGRSVRVSLLHEARIRVGGVPGLTLRVSSP